MRVVDLNIKRPRPAVALGIPMTEFVPRTAFWNLAYLFTSLDPQRDRLLPIHQTAIPATTRNEIIKGFLKEPGQDFLIMIDSDMVTPMNLVDEMVARDLPFLSGYCTRKTYPYLPIPAELVKTSQLHGETVYEYHPITNWEPDSGIRKCDGVGAALLCLKRELLEAIEPPWFKHEGGGEDYYFCRKVQAAGVDILVDTACVVGHIGEFTAWPADFFEHKAAWMAREGIEETDIVSLQKAV